MIEWVTVEKRVASSHKLHLLPSPRRFPAINMRDDIMRHARLIENIFVKFLLQDLRLLASFFFTD